MFIFIYNTAFDRLKTFEDLRHIPDVKLIRQNRLDMLFQVVMGKLHLKINVPCLFLHKINLDRGDYTFVIEPQVLLIWGFKWILNIQNRCGNRVKFILTIYDSMAASSPSLLQSATYFDKVRWNKIYTFDKNDAKRFDWEWLGFHYYSSFFPRISVTETKTDAYFVGGLKGGRTKLIMDVARHLLSNGVNGLFDLYVYSGNISPDDHIESIRYFSKWMKYSEIVNIILNTNCIIEILQENQHCQSYRYFEAVYFNKKLLTNNTNVVNYPFYDERYMKVFNNIEDIDINWLKKKEQIDYGYSNEFSPIHFLNRLRADMIPLHTTAQRQY